MILYKNQNFIYLYKNIFLKSISPALPLVGAFIILSDDAKYFLSSLSVTIQSYMSVILFGAISRFSVKQGRLQYFVGVRKLNEFKFISLLNAITLFLMLTIFGKISSVEICSIFVSLAVVFLSVDVVSEYASSSAVVIKSRNIFFILLGGLIIFYFYFLINDLFVYALFVVPSVIVLLDWGGRLYTQRRLPCYQGSCSEVYLEKAFDGTGWRPEVRLSVAKALGENSLMFLVHPTLTATEIAKTCDVLQDVLSKAQA